MKLIKETPLAETYEDNDKIIKNSKIWLEHLDSRWLQLYTEFNDEYHILPKIYDFTPHESIVMEKVPGRPLRLFYDGVFTERTFLDCMRVLQEIKYFMANFSSKKGFAMLHHDLTVDNILITSTHDYYVIDIDSIRFDWPCHTLVTLGVEGYLMNQLISLKLSETRYS